MTIGELIEPPPPVRRQVVQIAAAAGQNVDVLYALCDDGSVWAIASLKTEVPWRRLPDIPQNQ